MNIESDKNSIKEKVQLAFLKKNIPQKNPGIPAIRPQRSY